MVRIFCIKWNSLFRPREHNLSVEEIIRHTLWVESVVSKHGTSKRRETLPMASLQPSLEDVCSCYITDTLIDNWGKKAIRRRSQGTGRMKYLKHIPRRAKNGFREGTKPVSRKRRAATEKKWDSCTS